MVISVKNHALLVKKLALRDEIAKLFVKLMFNSFLSTLISQHVANSLEDMSLHRYLINVFTEFLEPINLI